MHLYITEKEHQQKPQKAHTPILLFFLIIIKRMNTLVHPPTHLPPSPLLQIYFIFSPKYSLNLHHSPCILKTTKTRMYQVLTTPPPPLPPRKNIIKNKNKKNEHTCAPTHTPSPPAPLFLSPLQIFELCFGFTSDASLPSLK